VVANTWGLPWRDPSATATAHHALGHSTKLFLYERGAGGAEDDAEGEADEWPPTPAAGALLPAPAALRDNGGGTRGTEGPAGGDTEGSGSTDAPRSSESVEAGGVSGGGAVSPRNCAHWAQDHPKSPKHALAVARAALGPGDLEAAVARIAAAAAAGQTFQFEQVNPKGRGSKAYLRYEVYKKETTFAGLELLRTMNFPGTIMPVFCGGVTTKFGDFACDVARGWVTFGAATVSAARPRPVADADAAAAGHRAAPDGPCSGGAALAARGASTHDAAVDAFVRRALPPAVAAANVADASAAAPTAADDGDEDEEILLVPHTPQLPRPMARPLPRPPCLVVVVRGLSGCGKSTFARTLGSAAAAAGRTFAVCSADKVR